MSDTLEANVSSYTAPRSYEPPIETTHYEPSGEITIGRTQQPRSKFFGLEWLIIPFLFFSLYAVTWGARDNLYSSRHNKSAVSYQSEISPQSEYSGLERTVEQES